MKKVMALVFAMVFALSFGAVAEEFDLSMLTDYVVLPGEKVTLDLDGDGSEEIFSCDIAYDDANYTETAMVNVIGDGTGADYLIDMYMANFYVLDINEDGIYEIFISGDQMSSDYATICLQFRDGKLLPVLFEDATRGENSEEALYAYGYGLLMYAGNGTVELNGSQDILGTYFGSRTFALQDDMFVLADDGLWHFTRDLMDEESWEYAGIVPVKDIPVTFVMDGEETEGVIAAGEKFMVIASDKVSVVQFIMQDGRAGYFAIEPDTEAGYGVKVNGVNEWELFENLPYAD